MHLCSSSFMWIFAENFQHSTDKHYTSSGRILLSMERICQFLKTTVFQTFLPTWDSEFRAALGHILDQVWFYQWWRSILISLTFSEDSAFPLCLCHVFFGVFFPQWMSVHVCIMRILSCWPSTGNAWRAGWSAVAKWSCLFGAWQLSHCHLAFYYPCDMHFRLWN